MDREEITYYVMLPKANCFYLDHDKNGMRFTYFIDDAKQLKEDDAIKIAKFYGLYAMERKITTTVHEVRRIVCGEVQA